MVNGNDNELVYTYINVYQKLKQAHTLFCQLLLSRDHNKIKSNL